MTVKVCLIKVQKEVMGPNTPTEKDEVIAKVIEKSSYFRSSGHDGFMQDFVLLNHDRAVPLPDDIDLSIISYTELVTVSLHAIRRFEKKSISNKNTFGIWGDVILGYITAILLRKLYPESKIYVFGKTDYKLSHFSFVDDVFFINKIPEGLTFTMHLVCGWSRQPISHKSNDIYYTFHQKEALHCW